MYITNNHRDYGGQSDHTDHHRQFSRKACNESLLSYLSYWADRQLNQGSRFVQLIDRRGSLPQGVCFVLTAEGCVMCWPQRVLPQGCVCYRRHCWCVHGFVTTGVFSAQQGCVLPLIKGKAWKGISQGIGFTFNVKIQRRTRTLKVKSSRKTPAENAEIESNSSRKTPA